MKDAHCMPNPWVSLRRDQLIPVNKAVNEKELLEKGLEEEEEKNPVLDAPKGFGVQCVSYNHSETAYLPGL
jgi:hypothetical protein